MISWVVFKFQQIWTLFYRSMCSLPKNIILLKKTAFKFKFELRCCLFRDYYFFCGHWPLFLNEINRIIHFLQCLIKKYHRVVDPKDSNKPSESSRIRQAISDKIHRVQEKIHPSKVEPQQINKPQIDSLNKQPAPSPYQPPSQPDQYPNNYPNNQIQQQSIPIDKSSSSSILKSVAKKIFHSKTKHGSGSYNNHNFQKVKSIYLFLRILEMTTI
jgi:hypothetical protein